jgi:hypothetical protein
LWTPTLDIGDKLLGGRLNITDTDERGDDENPSALCATSVSGKCMLTWALLLADTIPGMDREWDKDLGQADGRVPDALPPWNLFELVMNWVYVEVSALGHGNALFALKAALLTVLLALPIYIKGSSEFAYSAYIFPITSNMTGHKPYSHREP